MPDFDSTIEPFNDLTPIFFRHCKMRTAAHGVTMNEIASEKNIAALAPIGIGRM